MNRSPNKSGRAPKLILAALLFAAGWYAGAYFQPIFNPPPCTLTEAGKQALTGWVFSSPSPEKGR